MCHYLGSFLNSAGYLYHCIFFFLLWNGFYILSHSISHPWDYFLFYLSSFQKVFVYSYILQCFPQADFIIVQSLIQKYLCHIYFYILFYWFKTWISTWINVESGYPCFISAVRFPSFHIIWNIVLSMFEYISSTYISSSLSLFMILQIPMLSLVSIFVGWVIRVVLWVC